jgi:hypothetical protein
VVLSSLTNPKLQSVLQNLVPGTVLNEIQLDNGNALATPTFINYNRLTGTVLLSVGGLVTHVSATDIQTIQLT